MNGIFELKFISDLLEQSTSHFSTISADFLKKRLKRFSFRRSLTS